MIILLAILTILVVIAFFIGSIVFIARDANEHDQSPALWIVLFIFLGGLGLSIYLFVTKRIGWGIFWLIGAPLIIVFLWFSLFVGALSTM